MLMKIYLIYRAKSSSSNFIGIREEVCGSFNSGQFHQRKINIILLLFRHANADRIVCLVTYFSEQGLINELKNKRPKFHQKYHIMSITVIFIPPICFFFQIRNQLIEEKMIITDATDIETTITKLTCFLLVSALDSDDQKRDDISIISSAT